MKWLVILLGLVALILGLLPIVEGYISMPIFLNFIPREGQIYSGIIAIIGVALIYVGWKKL